MAKGMEDTLFYRDNRLVSLNEVGADLRRFAVSPAAFHHANQGRQRRWPNAMLCTPSYDTKRSEDARASQCAFRGDWRMAHAPGELEPDQSQQEAPALRRLGAEPERYEYLPNKRCWECGHQAWLMTRAWPLCANASKPTCSRPSAKPRSTPVRSIRIHVLTGESVKAEERGGKLFFNEGSLFTKFPVALLMPDNLQINK